MSYTASSSNKDGWMTVNRRQAPAAFGPRAGEERRQAPSAFMASRTGPREAPAAFSGQTRTWKQDDAPSAFGGGGGGRRDAPAAFGGGAAGEERKKRLEEKAAEARYRAEQAMEERRKAEAAAAAAKKAMDVNDEESYPTLGTAPAKKKGASTPAVSVVIDGTGAAATAAAAPAPAPAAPKSKWGPKPSAPAAANSWAPIAEEAPAEPKPLSMAQRIAAASARVDEEEAVRQAMEHRDRVLNRTSFAHYTEHQRRLATLPRRTLDDGFDDDPAYRCDYDEDDAYYANQGLEGEDEDGEFNADLHNDRRRGDKGVW